MKTVRQIAALIVGFVYMGSCGAIYGSDRLDLGDKLLLDLPLFVVAAVVIGLILPREQAEQ